MTLLLARARALARSLSAASVLISTEVIGYRTPILTTNNGLKNIVDGSCIISNNALR